MIDDIFQTLLNKAPRGSSLSEWQGWMIVEINSLYRSGIISLDECRDLISETLLRY